MATTALQYFRQRTPFTTEQLSDAEFNDWAQGIIDAGELDRDVWGDKYQLAIALLVGHYLTLASRTPGASGPITAERAGEVSLNYGFLSNWDGNVFDTTAPGQAFQALRRQLVGTRLFTTGMTAGEIKSG